VILPISIGIEEVGDRRMLPNHGNGAPEGV